MNRWPKKTPDVLEKLKDAIKRGQCEFMGSPYAHPMLPNFPKEDGMWSIQFSNKVYEDYLGIIPKSFWNPECGWRSYVPQQVSACGYKNMIGDFEAYSRSCDENGHPLRPEIYEKEYSKEPAFYNFGFKYDLPGTEKSIHFPFLKIKGCEGNNLKMFLRTDRIAQYGVRYFMGMEGYSLEEYMNIIKKYSQQNPDEPEAALVIFADDAEYIGTNGWFRLKYQNKPDNVFEETPDSRQKLIDLISGCNEIGSFTTFDYACNELPALQEVITFDDDSAWHGAKASTWAGTPMAQLLRPWQDLVREKLSDLADSLDKPSLVNAWYHLTNSYNSDGQWPPTLPESPHIIHPFNYRYCYDNLLKAEQLVQGVDYSRLETDPEKTIQTILGPQQTLVLEKCEIIAGGTDENLKEKALKAKSLILDAQNMDSLKARNSKTLHPDEYEKRANALVKARTLIGGIEIEKCE